MARINRRTCTIQHLLDGKKTFNKAELKESGVLEALQEAIRQVAQSVPEIVYMKARHLFSSQVYLALKEQGGISVSRWEDVLFDCYVRWEDEIRGDISQYTSPSSLVPQEFTPMLDIQPLHTENDALNSARAGHSNVLREIKSLNDYIHRYSRELQRKRNMYFVYKKKVDDLEEAIEKLSTMDTPMVNVAEKTREVLDRLASNGFTCISVGTDVTTKEVDDREQVRIIDLSFVVLTPSVKVVNSANPVQQYTSLRFPLVFRFGINSNGGEWARWFPANSENSEAYIPIGIEPVWYDTPHPHISSYVCVGEYDFGEGLEQIDRMITFLGDYNPASPFMSISRFIDTYSIEAFMHTLTTRSVRRAVSKAIESLALFQLYGSNALQAEYSTNNTSSVIVKHSSGGQKQ